MISSLIEKIENFSSTVDFRDKSNSLQQRNCQFQYLTMMSELSLLLSAANPKDLSSELSRLCNLSLGRTGFLPTFVAEGWIMILSKALSQCEQSSFSLAHFAPKLTDLVKALSKDRTQTDPIACNTLVVYLKFLCLVLKHSPCDVVLSPQNLPHPSKTTALGVRIGAFESIPTIIANTVAKGQTHVSPSLTQEWLTYMKKGMSCIKEFSVRESATQCLAECLSRGVLFLDITTAVSLVDTISKSLEESLFVSPKLTRSTAVALASILEAATLHGAASSNSSYWGIWKGAASAATFGKLSNAYSILNNQLFKSPMTRNAQLMLGDATSMFLSRVFAKDSSALSDGVDVMFALLVPTSTDNRAYAPKLVVRAIKLWSDSLDCNTFRCGVVQSLMKHLQGTTNTKSITLTALQLLTAVVPTLVSLPTNLSVSLFQSALAFVASPSSAMALAAAELCGHLCHLEMSCFQAVLTQLSEIVEDITEDNVPPAIIPIAKVLNLLSPLVKSENAKMISEVSFTVLEKLCSSVEEKESGNSHPHELLKRIDVIWNLAQLHLQSLELLGVPLSEHTLLFLLQQNEMHAKKCSAILQQHSSSPILYRAVWNIVVTLRKLCAATAANSSAKSRIEKILSQIAKRFLTMTKETHQRVPSSGSASSTQPDDGNNLRLRTELFDALSEGDYFHHVQQSFVAKAAIHELFVCTVQGIPSIIDDAALFPSAVASVMSTCRRMNPSLQQQPASNCLAAALRFLAHQFSHQASDVGHKTEVLAAVFDLLSSNGTVHSSHLDVMKWNAICSLFVIVSRESRQRLAKKLWKAMGSLAKALRSQLVDVFLPSSILDIQVLTAKTFALFASFVDDDVTDISRFVVQQSPDNKCAVLLLLSESCVAAKHSPAVSSLVPLVASYFVGALKQNDLYGDPCSATAMALVLSLVTMVEAYPETLLDDVVVPQVLPLMLRPSTLCLDPVIVVLKQALLTTLFVWGEGKDWAQVEWRGFVCLSQELWHESLLSPFTEAAVRNTAMALLEKFSSNALCSRPHIASLIRCGIENALLRGAPENKISNDIAKMASVHLSERMNLSFAAHCIDRCSTLDSRALWCLVMDQIGAVRQDRKCLEEILRTLTAKLPSLQKVEAEASTAIATNVKSDVYGELVEDVVATNSAVVVDELPCDVAGRDGLIRCLIATLESGTNMAFMIEQLDLLMRTICVALSSADIHKALIPNATCLVVSLINRLGSLTDDVTRLPLLMQWRTQLAGSIKYLVRAVTPQSNPKLIVKLCTGFLASNIADDSLSNRVLQSLLARVQARQDNTTFLGVSVDETVLLTGCVGCMLDQAQRNGWKLTIDAAKQIITGSPALQQALHLYGLAVAAQFAKRCGYCIVDDPLVENSNYVCFSLWSALLTSCGVCDADGSYWMGPTLRNTFGVSQSLVIGWLVKQRDALEDRDFDVLMGVARLVGATPTLHRETIVNCSLHLLRRITEPVEVVNALLECVLSGMKAQPLLIVDASTILPVLVDCTERCPRSTLLLVRLCYQQHIFDSELFFDFVAYFFGRVTAVELLDEKNIELTREVLENCDEFQTCSIAAAFSHTRQRITRLAYASHILDEVSVHDNFSIMLRVLLQLIKQNNRWDVVVVFVTAAIGSSRMDQLDVFLAPFALELLSFAIDNLMEELSGNEFAVTLRTAAATNPGSTWWRDRATTVSKIVNTLIPLNAEFRSAIQAFAEEDKQRIRKYVSLEVPVAENVSTNQIKQRSRLSINVSQFSQ